MKIMDSFDRKKFLLKDLLDLIEDMGYKDYKLDKKEILEKLKYFKREIEKI